MTMRKDPWSARKNLYSASVPKAVKKPKVKWRVLPILWVAFKRTSMVIGAFMIISAVIATWSLSSLFKEIEPKKLPNNFVLYMDLGAKLGDLPKDVSLADPFGGAGITVKDIIEALERAKNDPHVRGIYARMEGGKLGLANIQELRGAIKDFRKSGKFAYIYSSSYGGSGGLGNYYLSRAFDERWIQPMGIVVISGINAELPFFRSILDKLGVEPQFFQRKEYKSAYESLMHSDITDPNKRMMEYLIKDLSNTINEDIAADMGILKSNFQALVDKGLFTAKEALDSGLVDKVGYLDQLIGEINKQVTGDADTRKEIYVNINNYIKNFRQRNMNMADAILAVEKKKPKIRDNKPSVALIYAVGLIMPTDSGKKSPGPASFFDDGIAAADEISSALIDAAYDDDIKAVILRVNSPGGSPVASETILRATQILKDKGKPVIVSMGSTAASGGYWISAYADRIFVLPTTITGSIGVIGGKISTSELWNKLGVKWERIQSGKNAGMWSMNTPFSESESERINAMLDNVYDNFLERVAKGRKMSIKEVDRIAGGRVWTGKSAIKIGLADEKGGLFDAIDYAAKKVGAKDHKGVHIVIMPRPKTPIERLVSLLENQVSLGNMIGTQAQILEQAKPLLTEMDIISNPQLYTVYSPISVK